MKPDSGAGKLMMPVGPRDHATGDERAAITLVEYGDYECSFCGRAYPIVKNIRRHFGDKLRFVFRNFALAENPHAEVAAEVAEAAAAQGKFWQIHDMMFEHQNALELGHLLDYARKLELDVKRVASDVEGRVYLPRVKEDFESGTHSGLTGTPGFFVNGALFDGDWSGPGLIEALTAHAP